MERSTGVSRPKEAERVAAKWEADLQEGRYKIPSKVPWDEFHIRYEDEIVPGFADKTAGKVSAVFNAVERILNPRKLAAVTADRISYHQSKLREAGLAESTIKGHMAHLLAALNWAHRIDLLNDVPKIDMPRRTKRSKKMKGRPATTEEFERMLAKTPAVVGKPAAESWRHYLRGLWWSGLRLEESLELWWDRDDKLCVDLTGKYPMLHIPAELEKGNQDRLLPIAPEFAEFLLATPEAERTGRVFKPMAIRPGAPRPKAKRVGEIVSIIGRASGVKVNTDPRTGKVKYASAHDLRRSFGIRWAMRVMPAVLQQLMRHEKIETTLKYYVGRNAEMTAAALYEAVSGSSDIFGDSAPKSSFANDRTPLQVNDATGLVK